MTAPVVAQRRRDGALAAFRKKNKVLQEVVERKRMDTLPSRLTDEAYCHWTSAADGVAKFSTFTFYNSKNETERIAAEKGLKALETMRRATEAKKAFKALTVDDVKKQLKAEEGRSRSFANQYNEQMKLNEELVQRIRKLEQNLSRANKELAQVRPLRTLPTRRKMKEPSEEAGE